MNELYDIMRLVNDSDTASTWNVVTANYNGIAWHLTIEETNTHILLPEIVTTFVTNDAKRTWKITRAEYDDEVIRNTWYVTLKREKREAAA